MKKFITAAAISILTTTAGAQSFYYEDTNTVVSPADGRNDLTVLVSILPTNNCKPVFTLAGDGQNPNKEVSYYARIDRRPQWNITGNVSHSENGKYTYVETWAPNKLINELRRGGILRVKLPQMDGGDDYASFSLIGFSSAFSKAKAACIPPSQYFEQDTSADNAEYFL